MRATYHCNLALLLAAAALLACCAQAFLVPHCAIKASTLSAASRAAVAAPARRAFR